MTVYALKDTAWAMKVKREARRRKLTERRRPKRWRFEFGERVRFRAESGPQIGVVRARTEYVDEPDRFNVEFTRDGCVERRWLPAAQLVSVELSRPLHIKSIRQSAEQG